jgi:GntR family transcriptional regulator
VADLHLGHLRPDDRLPSVRTLGEELGVDPRAVARAYRRLAHEGLLEIRERNGVYLARQEPAVGGVREELVTWLASVVAEARRRGIGIPQLSELLRTCTNTVLLRCICFESNLDSGVAFALELEEEFGINCDFVDIDTLPKLRAGRSTAVRRIDERLKRADFFVTSAFHQRAVQTLAKRFQKPFHVITVNEQFARIIERQIAKDGLTAIIADERYARRLRVVYGAVSEPAAIQITLASDRDRVLLLNRSAPALVTRAARRLLPDLDIPLLIPRYPSISPESARGLGELIIRLNLERRSQQSRAANPPGNA